MKRLFLGIVALVLSCVASASLVQNWTKQIDGAGASYDGRDKVAGDSLGNTYLVHEPVKAATNSRDVTLTKFAPDGTVAWERTLPNSSSTNERSGQVFADTSAAVYTGILRVGSEDRAVISLVKPDGQVQFTTDLGPVLRLHSVHSLGANQGYLVTMEAIGLLGESVVQVVRVSASGARLWKESFATSHAVSHNILSVSTGTNFIALGGYTSTSVEGSVDFPFVVAFNFDGEELWHERFFFSPGRVVGLQVFGSTVIAQTSPDPDSGGPGLLLKYGPTGAPIWRNALDVIEGAVPIAGFGNSNAFVVLNSTNAWGALRFRPTSSFPFVYGMYPVAGTPRQAESIAHDMTGAIVAGRAFQTNWRPSMAKYDDVTRAEVWSFTSAVPAAFGRAVVLSSGSIVLIGRTAINQILLHRFSQTVAVQKVEISVASGNANVKPKVKVTLASKAPLGGIAVNLASNSSRLSIPSKAIVAAGAQSAEVSANVLPVSTDTLVKVSATAGAVTRNVDFTVLAPKVDSVTVVPQSARGGSPYSVAFKLDSPAPDSFVCTVTAPAALGLPSTVTFANSQSIELNRTTPNTSVDTNHVIKLTKYGITKQATFKALRPALKNIDLAGTWPPTKPRIIVGGDPIKVRVDLFGKSNAAVPVTMTESMANLVGGNFSVPAGQDSVEVTRTTSLPSDNAVIGTVSFTVLGETKSGQIAIVRALILDLDGDKTPPHSQPSTFKVVLTRPAPSGGVKVTLSYGPGLSKLGITNSIVTVPAGAKERTFVVFPPKPASTVQGVLKATVSSVSSVSETVTVLPGP